MKAKPIELVLLDTGESICLRCPITDQTTSPETNETDELIIHISKEFPITG